MTASGFDSQDPSWDQELLGAGNLSDKLGASWGPVIGSNAGARSLGAPGSPGAPPPVVEKRGVLERSGGPRFKFRGPCS